MFAIPLMDVFVREVEALGLDPKTFRAFYEEALPRVYGFLHRCGGSVPVAEDLTQETFLASVDELKKGRRPEAPIPWIYGIARHKLLDHYRKQAKAEQPLADAGLALEESAFPVQDDQGRERAVAALAAVPAAQRTALVLCYLDGFTAAEVGGELGKSTAAVHSLLERGRDLGREIVDDLAEHSPGRRRT
jgi:RNA polymerase sigma-70 factor (ECF subfamily)